MTTVLALDLSATKAGVVWPDGTVEVLEPAKKLGTGVARLHWWYSTIRVRLDALDRAPDVIAVEEPAYNKAGQAGVQSTAMVRGVVALACRHAIGEDRWVDITNGSIKKYATGKGNCDKNAVKAACRRRMDWNGESADEADALWLWALVRHACGEPVVEVPKLHQEAIGVVREVLAKRLGIAT